MYAVIVGLAVTVASEPASEAPLRPAVQVFPPVVALAPVAAPATTVIEPPAVTPEPDMWASTDGLDVAVVSVSDVKPNARMPTDVAVAVTSAVVVDVSASALTMSAPLMLMTGLEAMYALTVGVETESEAAPASEIAPPRLMLAPTADAVALPVLDALSDAEIVAAPVVVVSDAELTYASVSVAIVFSAAAIPTLTATPTAPTVTAIVEAFAVEVIDELSVARITASPALTVPPREFCTYA
jgi:hypothetical protein